MAHYALDKELFLTTDASSFGIGGVLSHKNNGEERPVVFISRTLSDAEKKYSQTEREALAIIFACEKLKQYLIGRNFTIITDHKPLVMIFGDKKALPPLVANRLHRWALKLCTYDFKILYKSGKEIPLADFLSRFAVENREEEHSDEDGELLLLEASWIDFEVVAKETMNDETLAKVKEVVENAKEFGEGNSEWRSYEMNKNCLSVIESCVYKGSKNCDTSNFKKIDFENAASISWV